MVMRLMKSRLSLSGSDGKRHTPDVPVTAVIADSHALV
jgi:hypothetical protein